jgi:hypothetical protein
VIDAHRPESSCRLQTKPAPADESGRRWGSFERGLMRGLGLVGAALQDLGSEGDRYHCNVGRLPETP